MAFVRLIRDDETEKYRHRPAVGRVEGKANFVRTKADGDAAH